MRLPATLTTFDGGGGAQENGEEEEKEEEEVAASLRAKSQRIFSPRESRAALDGSLEVTRHRCALARQYLPPSSFPPSPAYPVAASRE